jgi:DNA-binding MarR family transcriptional regulator
VTPFAASDRIALAAQMRGAVQIIERWVQRTVHRGTGTLLSPNETHLLSHLAEGPAQRMSSLADRQGVDRSTMSLQIRSLVQRGLIERTPDPTDRRASLIALSEEGREVLEEYVARASQILERTVRGWSDEELERFEQDLSRFAADLTTTVVEEAGGAS